VIARCGPATDDGDCAGRIVAPRDGVQWAFEGPLTLGNAGTVLGESAALTLPASDIVDCSALTAVDSAAITVLLALKRRAVGEGRELHFNGLPAPLLALADVYDVRELLGIS
jgi:phospholipid transport system transporter-binding protein